MRFFITLILSFTLGFGLAQDNIDPNEVVASSKSLSVYTENGRMGLKKNVRKYITPAIYDTLYQLNAEIYVGKRYNSTKQTAYWGAINNSGDIVLPFKYLTLAIQNGLFLIGYTENNQLRYGVNDLEGNALVVPKYSSIKMLSSDIIEGRLNGKTMIFNYQGQKLGEFIADSVALLNDQFVKVFKDGKVGAKKMNNTYVSSLQFRDIKIKDSAIYVQKYPEWNIIQGFDSIAFFYDSIRYWGKTYIATSANKNQVVDRGAKPISKSYDSIHAVNPRVALVKNGTNWGAINNIGDEIIDLNYAEIFSDDVILAARGHGSNAPWSIFDLYGFPKTKLRYNNVRSIQEGRIPVERNGRWGFLDRYGVEIIAPIFDSVGDFRNGMATVMFFGEGGIIDRSGKWIITPDRSRILDFNELVVITKSASNYEVSNFNNDLIYFSENKLEIDNDGLIEYDSSGQIQRTISWQGTITSEMSYGKTMMTGGNGYFIFKENGRYGFKDYKGRIRIANRYEDVMPFHQDYAAIKINNKWGFINLEESIIVQPTYDSVGYFIDSNCITMRKGKLGVINSSGKEIIKNTYQDIIRLSDGNFRVKQTGKWGVLSETGGVIIHTRYNKLIDTNKGYYIVQQKGKYGTIDNGGVSKIPLLYDYIGYDEQTKTLITKKSTKEKWTLLKKVHSTD